MGKGEAPGKGKGKRIVGGGAELGIPGNRPLMTRPAASTTWPAALMLLPRRLNGDCTGEPMMLPAPCARFPAAPPTPRTKPPTTSPAPFTQSLGFHQAPIG